MYLTKRQQYESLKEQLKQERNSFISHWTELGEYISPRRPRFTVSDVNKGDRRNTKIVNSTATLAMRTLRSGMMSGVTSPARPWFRLTTPDPAFAEEGAVKEWLHFISERMATVFLRSNLYNVLPQLYGDLGTFGTAAMLVEEDFQDVIRCYCFPIGSYTIAKDNKGRVNTFTRDFRMTVRQLVSEFAKSTSSGEIIWDNLSTAVRDLWQRQQYEQWIDVAHVIQPNHEYDEKALKSKHKKFVSCYFESGGSSTSSANYMAFEPEKYLRESGYDYFPVLVPRWEVTAEDVYGTSCPGMEALGDIKALQLMEKRKAMAIEKMVNPPLVGPARLRNQKVSILPGDISWDDSESKSGLRPVHEVNPHVQELIMNIQEHERRIQRCMYEDLFLMLAQSDRRDITAREIEERHEEKLLALGPVLEQLNQDLLDPLIDITFDIMLRQRLVPPPPEEIQDQDLKVEYTSIMAQAQKSMGLAGLERLTQFALGIAAVQPDVLIKLDLDQLIDEHGSSSGVSPRVIRPDEKCAEIRAQNQQAAQAQMQAEQASAMRDVTGSVKDLAQAPIEGDNALGALVDMAESGSLVEGGL